MPTRSRSQTHGLLWLATRWLLGRRFVRRTLAVIVVLLGEWMVVTGVAGSSGGPVTLALTGVAWMGTLAAMAAFWLWLRQRRTLRVRRFESLLALTPRGFEEEIARLLRALGYRDVRRVGGPGDLGADLLCRDRRGRLVVVQCKRYAPGRRVGSADVQSFIGMVTVHHRAERGLFVTTAAFTQPAIELARRHGIGLLDGAALARLVAERGNGAVPPPGETHTPL